MKIRFELVLRHLVCLTEKADSDTFFLCKNCFNALSPLKVYSHHFLKPCIYTLNAMIASYPDQAKKHGPLNLTGCLP